MDDAALEAALFPPAPPSRLPRPEPDWSRVHRELRRHEGVTLRLLWLEYRTGHPDGYGYSRFCDRYRLWRGRLDVVLRQVYRAGEKAFVDYAGPKFAVVDGRTGAAGEAPGQGEGGDRRPARRALGHGASAQPDILLTRRTPRRHRAARGRAQRAPAPEDRGQPPELVRGSGPSGAQAASRPALRVRPVAQGPRQPHPYSECFSDGSAIQF